MIRLYRRSLWLFLVLLCGSQRMAHAQSLTLDEQAFRAMSDAERYRFVHDFSFAKMDSATAYAVLNRMHNMAREKKDTRTVLAAKYRRYKEEIVTYPSSIPIFTGSERRTAITEMAAEARQYGFEVEEVVGNFFLAYEIYKPHDLPSYDMMYVEIKKAFEKIEAIGFEKFRDYEPEFILRFCIQFMWNLEDYEEAYRYLSYAERVIQPTEENQPYLTLVLSRLQSYWQNQKKDYPKAIEYAQKIRYYYQRFQFDEPKKQWISRFWQGFLQLSIAEMRLAQGDTADVEASADAGYALTKRAEDNTDIYARLAEYEALQVYVPIKMAFGKQSEAGRLLKRAAAIKKQMGARWEVNVFKHIKFYENYARYQEMQGNAAEALRYTHLARALQDSLDERNDIRKFERIEQRLQAEKYAARLQLVESEKELQKLLRNAVFIIMALVLLLMYGWFHRRQYLYRRRVAELEAAQNELTDIVTNFQRKAEIVENLRLEIARLSAADEHSQYLEQLLSSTILTEDDWLRFRTVFEKAFPGFIEEQKTRQPDITPAELRYLALEKLQLNTHEMARMLGVSDNSVRQTRARLRRRIKHE